MQLRAEFMDHAKQTVDKPANYLGINMLVELESCQEMKVIDARGKVFSECCIFTIQIILPKDMIVY